MPYYSYKCSNCEIVYTLRRSMNDRNNELFCSCGGACVRDFESEVAGQIIVPPTKTLGSLGDKNASKFSNDYKQHLQDKNKKRKRL